MFKAINIASTGLSSQRLRMDVISRNIANANATRTASGKPYRRQVPIFRSIENLNFGEVLKGANKRFLAGQGVEVSSVEEDMSPFKQVYNPGHPDANEDGIVLMPNVDTVTEMVNLISASRAYEASVTSMNTAKAMAMKALEIGR